MKITKRQLRRIIKEEKQRLLKEAAPAGSGAATEISEQLGKLHDTINILFELMEPYELALELEGIAADLKEPYDSGF